MYMLNMLHESESVKSGSDLAKLATDYSNRRTRNHDIVIMVFDNYQEISLKKLLHKERNNTATKHITKTLMRSTLLQTFPNYLWKNFWLMEKQISRFSLSLWNTFYLILKIEDLVTIWQEVIRPRLNITRVYPTGIYLLNVNNRNTRTRCEKCSELTIKIPERCQWRYC